MTAVLTIVRRRPGAVASLARSVFASGCMSIARPTSIRRPDEKTNGGAPPQHYRGAIAGAMFAVADTWDEAFGGRDQIY